MKCQECELEFRRGKRIINTAKRRENRNWGSWKRGAFIRIPFSEIPEWAKLRAGRFSYNIKIKQRADPHERTVARIGENRILDARLRAKRSQEFANKNSPTPTIQLQSLRSCMVVIAYRKWNFRTLDVSMVSLKFESHESETYIQFPKEIENGNGRVSH